ncbi:MAG TPA: universal stress protein [Noviherbaspirillum sp.]|nr:universal stress protein [Noviherbaspirillum sp.]
MKILIAVDGSAYSTKAVKHVIKHFNWFSSIPELHLLHVKLPLPSGGARSFLGSDMVNRYYEEESLAALAASEKILKKKEIPFRSSWKVGDIPKEIQSYVKKNKIDLIVMGSHGHGAFTNLVMGSIATKVLASTDVPVMIVR